MDLIIAHPLRSFDGYRGKVTCVKSEPMMLNLADIKKAEEVICKYEEKGHDIHRYFQPAAADSKNPLTRVTIGDEEVIFKGNLQAFAEHLKTQQFGGAGPVYDWASVTVSEKDMEKIMETAEAKFKHAEEPKEEMPVIKPRADFSNRVGHKPK